MLAHGGGGQLTDELLRQCIMPRLDNAVLNQLLDSAILPDGQGGRLAMTIDSFVVQPLEFPGGNIGDLAVAGTVNDLAVCGATPLGIALSLVLCEGLPIPVLERVLDAVAATARKAGVTVVTGDTKVVGHGQADGIFITTAGVGRIPAGLILSPTQVQPGDMLIINGPLGEHGLAVMLAREMPELITPVKSDVAPLNSLINAALAAAPGQIRFMRDPTRGGLAGLCADLATHSGYRVVLDETHIPLRPEARHAADLLGLDPLEIANEGKVVVVVAPAAHDRVLQAMRAHPLAESAVTIGHIGELRDGLCEIRTTIGGRRIVAKPYGEQLPRIC